MRNKKKSWKKYRIQNVYEKCLNHGKTLRNTEEKYRKKKISESGYLYETAGYIVVL